MRLFLVLVVFTTGLNFEVLANHAVENADVTDQQFGGEKVPVDQESHSQNFFPAFSPFGNPPLGHSRPFFFQQEGAYSQRPSAYQQQLGFDAPKFSGYKGSTFDNRARVADASETHQLLGSGNFGVINGGTFYNDNDKKDSNNYEAEDDDFNTYYRNGHGRPSFYVSGASNPRPQKQEQFANFKDFADINTGSNPAYSHIVIVYANKNDTKPKQSTNRKNILEALVKLDKQTTSESVPPKKLSKSKRKLALLLPEKKIRYKKINEKESKYIDESTEPMLALS